MSIKDDVIKIAKAAREASRRLAGLSSEVKNKALLKMADGLDVRRQFHERRRADVGGHARDLRVQAGVEIGARR